MKGKLMRLWLDTEFNGFKGALISMALVDEKGREWYEVLRCTDPVPWVEANVISLVRKRATTPARLRKSLWSWLRVYDTIHVIADWPEDFAHFCAVLVTGPGLRLVVPALTMELLELTERPTSALPHNALEDARALRQAHMRILAAEGVVAKPKGRATSPGVQLAQGETRTRGQGEKGLAGSDRPD